jgi:hypothetical protein
MIQHDQQSRWKAWMRLLAVDIRPITMSYNHEYVAKVDFAFDWRTNRGVLSAAMRPSVGRPDLRLAHTPPARGTTQ